MRVVWVFVAVVSLFGTVLLATGPHVFAALLFAVSSVMAVRPGGAT